MLPNLIIIGAGKSGTSSLHYYLNQHPEIFMSEQKELNFFTEGVFSEKGLEWYQSNFTGSAKIYGESSPYYTFYPKEKGIVQRMHSIIPNAKLIYLVRNPIERIISHYADYCRGFDESRTLDEALEDLNDNVYIDVSRYYMQVEQYLRLFPRASILVLTSENLRDNRKDTLQKAFRFLGVDESFWTESFNDLRNVSKGKKKKKRSMKPWKWQRVFLSDTFYGRIWRGITPNPIVEKIRSDVEAEEDYVPPQMSDSLKMRIYEHLESDINKLREFTRYELKDWAPQYEVLH